MQETIQSTIDFVAHFRAEAQKVIVGQKEVIDQCLLALLCGGHALLEGVPGIAKTLISKTCARLLTLSFHRVQCTSDLMPADILGVNILNLSTNTFVLRRGPVFTDILLADEINRMPPRTQAALLEAMEERQATLDGVRHPLSSFFTVFATQNPIEFEGTYPLPEAQLDRFLLKIKVPYPAAEEEARLLANTHQGFDAHEFDQMELAAVDSSLLGRARAEVRAVKVEPALFGYITQIVRRSRDWPSVSLGASPRAAIALLQVGKASAAMNDRDYLLPDDVKQVAHPLLRHRLVLKAEADLEGVTADQVIDDIVGSVE
ncbi:MAG: MoxR family ATPase, partial [Acidobacteria bacterium]|nr:MoxR family ATPase [Acidobacteriota bacterium]